MSQNYSDNRRPRRNKNKEKKAILWLETNLDCLLQSLWHLFSF